MKKVLSMLLVVVMAMSMISVSSVFAADINVTIDGKAQNYDVMPVIENGRTLVPMRAIFESLGASVQWDDATKTVTGTKGSTSVVLTIGNAVAKVNNADTTLDVPAKILDGRTLVPVRFISETLGCKVNWDDATKTVIIATNSDSTSLKPGMAELVSDYHRPIPTTFTKSNDPDDILHFDGMTPEQQEAAYLTIKGQGVVVCTEDKFLEEITTTGPEYGTSEVIDVEGQPFKKALRITCNAIPEKSALFISRTKATPEKNPGDGVKKEDVMLLAFRMRTISTDAEDGKGKVQVQIEHPETYAKALFEYASAKDEWTVIYLPFTGVENATSIGIRGGFAKQVVELGGIEIVNLGPDYDIKKLPKTTDSSDELKPDSQWRKDANARIEQLRKGDFSVVVKDKDGNVIPDAEVEFDMFEHEFQFGNLLKHAQHGNENYMKNLSALFNSAVVEHSLKWAPYEDSPKDARKQIEEAKAVGIKYIRGHSLFWERMLGSNGVTYLTPKYMESEEIMSGNNKALFDEYCEKHVKEICTDFYNDLVEWDVINEILQHRYHANVYGLETWKDQFAWARKYTKPGTDLYYNDYAQMYDQWIPVLEEFLAVGADFDGIGFQSHYDSVLYDPTRVIAKYELMETYGDKKLKVTEYSCSIPDLALQANYTRDILIASFAEDDMTGFLYWGMWDGANFAAYSPFFDTEWNIKPAGEQYIDLVYNKWWTKDAKATTDAQGKATIRGFYGDYDITVNANGKTKTVMAAYHKGYENVLEITVE